MKKRKTKTKSNLPFRVEKNKFGSFFVLLLFILSLLIFAYQSFYLSKALVEVEAIKEYNETQEEIQALKNQIDELRIDFENYYSQKSNFQEDQKKIAEKIRHLNYLNSHLLKTVEQYNQDYSIRLFKGEFNNLENIYREVVNIQLISSRIANKVDTLLLFETISKSQIELLEKDFSLFYDKIEEIKLLNL